MAITQALFRRWSNPSGPALRVGSRTISWSELEKAVRRAASWLEQRGVGSGSIVALQTERSPTFLELTLAALALGAAVVPINDSATPTEVRYVLLDARPHCAILVDRLQPEFPEAFSESALPPLLAACAEHPLETELDNSLLAFIAYTSGTTGRPKGALLTHAQVLATVAALHQGWKWTSDDVILHALPLFHIHGLFVAQLGALYAGACTLWMSRFDPKEALFLLADKSCTVFMGVPTFYHRFLELPKEVSADLTGMRLFTCGSAALPASVLEAFEKRFGHRILERYGMTEIGIAVSNPYDGPRKAGSIGLPLPGVEAKILSNGVECAIGERGLLHIRSPGVFSGYLGREEATQTVLHDGWMNTGDIAHRDAEGFLYLSGRNGDLIICGGFNVYPAEVEAALLSHPAVAEAGVVGVPDVDLGERVLAHVVVRSLVSSGDLLTHLRQHLTPYKIPKGIRFVENLPRNSMGKVLKDQLRQDWGRLEIRRAERRDAGRLIASNRAMALETENIELDPKRSEEGVVRPLTEPGICTYYIAERNGQYVGQCMITKEWSDWRGTEIWWVQSVYVLPDYRGQGVYRALYNDVWQRAQGAGAAGLRLYVDLRNRAACDVYEKLGMNGDHYRLYEQMFDASATTP